MKEVIGAILIAIPLIAMFAITMGAIGWLKALFLWGVAALMVGFILVGSYLLAGA